MEAKEIIQYISDAEKKTPVKVYIKGGKGIDFPNCKVFGAGDVVVFGDWKDIEPVLEANAGIIEDKVIENDRRNSALPLLDFKGVNARIEPGATIREKAVIGDGAVVMMGATINIGAEVGPGTMVDMNAVMGGRASTGKNCHVGAGAVLAGVIEPPSAKPVTLGDDVLVGANAVVLEGVTVGSGSVVAAGAVVIEDVPEGVVVAGIPARVIKEVKNTEASKIEIVSALRNLK
ncbi:MAG: 2,3,4,5-tetrahydropyridine-2,6-dicarboxylate N-acetyltransferase [Clostridiales Family XIII bacterium]|nr:2,3,4,5-tetrahydropyridine-2,6-dicarboxylate N-acetyltransferase [Clostridiales Family XIII bacterium]